MNEEARSSLHLIIPPYRQVQRLASVPHLPRSAGRFGPAMIWMIGDDFHVFLGEVSRRPPGVPLIGILPMAKEGPLSTQLLRAVEQCRPVSLLPFCPIPQPAELRRILRLPPDDLVSSVLDFMRWRGMDLCTEARMLFRKTFSLALEVQSVSALGRALYLSRRALGRRFSTLGLPVPSHCLQFSRLIRAHVRVQATGDSLSKVAVDLGYPDAFSLSNQMRRLLDLRPSEARDRLGWEWLVETWLVREEGGLLEDSQGTLRLHEKAAWLRRKDRTRAVTE